MKKPTRQKPTLSERVTKLEKIIRQQNKKIKELETEIKRLDIEEITELPKTNMPNELNE